MSPALLALATACRTGELPPLPTFPRSTATTGGTAETGLPPTAATGDTGGPEWSVTWDKESWPDWAKDDVIPDLSADVLVAPSIRIVGFPSANLSSYPGTVVPAHGTDPGVIFAVTAGPAYTGVDQPPAFLFSGALTRGEYTLYDAWDGVSGAYTAHPDEVGETGDVDGDGHLDSWNLTNLFLGPILGRGYPPFLAHDGAIAWLDGAWAGHLPGAYDGDGDGVGDVVFTLGVVGYMAYGPFQGALPVPDYFTGPAPGWTQFGQQWCSDPYGPATLLRDHLGPGHDAFVIGRCYDDVSGRIYDLEGPRGRSVPIADQVSQINASGGSFGEVVTDAGDMNGDGYGDVSIGQRMIVAGPTHGIAEEAPSLVTAPMFEQPGLPVGDMNGDGVSELLAFHDATDDWVVLFSPHATPLDLDGGLLLVRGGFELSYTAISPRGDIDGDGNSDLVYGASPYPPEERGELRIWLGADLASTWQTQRARATARPNLAPRRTP